MIQGHGDSWLFRPEGRDSTHGGYYVEQVEQQMLRLFDNMEVDTPIRVMSTSSGLVRLKRTSVNNFILEINDNAQSLAAQTFTGEQLVQLCEASARDGGRYIVHDSDGTHRLRLNAGDAWTVKVVVRAKGMAANNYTNNQVWAIRIEQT